MGKRITKAELARRQAEQEVEAIKQRIAAEVERAKSAGVALEVANRIERGEAFNEQYERATVGPGFHSALLSELCKRGWSEYSTGSRCTVAYGGENHLQKDGRAVEMITSSFFGVFTTVHAFSKTW